MKTRINKFRRALVDRSDDVEQLALGAISALDRAVAKGVLHRNNVARRKSRLMKRLGREEPKAPAKPTARGSSRKR